MHNLLLFYTHYKGLYQYKGLELFECYFYSLHFIINLNLKSMLPKHLFT